MKRDVWWKDHLSRTNNKINHNTSSKSQENTQQRSSPRIPFQESYQHTTKSSLPKTTTHLHHQTHFKTLTISHHKYPIHPQDQSQSISHHLDMTHHKKQRQHHEHHHSYHTTTTHMKDTTNINTPPTKHYFQAPGRTNNNGSPTGTREKQNKYSRSHTPPHQWYSRE